MSNYNYDVGDNVACVDGKFPPGIGALYDQLPEQGRTYVVRDMRIGVALGSKRLGEISVLLVGIKNPHGPPPASKERGFAGWRFAKPLPAKREVVADVEKGKLVTA